MQRAMWVALGVAAVVSSAAALRLGAASSVEEPRVMTRAEYEGAMAAIENDRAPAFARCEERRALNEREMCRAQMEAAELTRVASIEVDFRRSAEAARAEQRARIEARYRIDRARCAALAGTKKDQCLIDAHAGRGRALLEAAAPYEERG